MDASTYPVLCGPWTQILFHYLLKNKPALDVRIFQHHILRPTGACLFLLSKMPFDVELETPILVLFPSLTSCVDDFTHLINYVILSLGWRVAVVHKRGQHCSVITDTGFEMIGDDDETEQLLRTVRLHFSKGPFLGYGLSAGAIMLSRFLCKKAHIAEELGFVAGAAVSGAFDFAMIENGSGLARCVLMWKCITQFDLPWRELAYDIWHMAHQNSPIWKLVSLNEFIHYVSVSPHVMGLKVPLLSIHSKDDPVFQWDDSYHLLAKEQPLLHLLVTERGSHGTFISHHYPQPELSWAEKKALRFLSDVLSAPEGRCVAKPD